MPDTLVPFTGSAELLLLGIYQAQQSSNTSGFWMNP
jgi:hypothetical protein